VWECGRNGGSVFANRLRRTSRGRGTGDGADAMEVRQASGVGGLTERVDGAGMRMYDGGPPTADRGPG